MDLLAALLGRGAFLPHGYCLTWSPGLLWSMVVSDIVIAASYFSIPLAMLTFARRRRGSSIRPVIWLFCAFIFACGITHVLDVWTIWQPDYGLQALSKVLTAVVSMITAVALWPLIPKALKIPTVRELQSVIVSLEDEMKQRRSAQESLSDTQEALVITLASIDAGFIATDREGRVSRMNSVAERITGWTQNEALGRPIVEVFVREDRPLEYLNANPVDIMLEVGITIDTVHRVTAIAAGGERTPLEVKAALTYAPDGAVRGLAMVFRDMSKLDQAAAKASELASIVESSYDAIIAKTLDGRITSWNRAAQALFGYSPEEAIGQSITMLIPSDHMAEEARILEQLAAGVRVDPFETVRLRKDGSLVDVSITISPLRDDQGRIVGASKIVRDVSQRKVAEALRLKGQRLEAENRQIQEASRLKSEFLANMSHELRTPLNAIIGFADLLLSGSVAPQSPKQKQFLGHIATSGRHLLQLINDVLDLSKVEAGKVEFYPEAVNLGGLIGEVVEILRTSASRNGLSVFIDVDPSLDSLVLDSARLKQALYNYLSNAIKFTPTGGRVTVRARAEGDEYFRIEVEDSGIGIAPADLSRLFVEFQQLDSGPAKKHQGTGLGLALTRRLIQAQGGWVGVRSTPGVGSVFYLVLRRDTSRPAVVTAAGEDTHTSHRFLVIRENMSDQTRMALKLTEAGFQVDTAHTGEQAVWQARNQSYDAITLDLVLPDCSGLEALFTIRSEGPSRRSPVVAVTVGAGPAASFAVSDILFKPVQTEQVVCALNKIGLNRTTAKVMVIDDDPLALDLMHATLRSIGIQAVGINSGQTALREMDQHRPDAIILDLMMPDFDGFETLDALRKMPAGRSIPVFIWTSMMLTSEEYARLHQSAHAILSKGGGTLEMLLNELREWRPFVSADHPENLA